MTVRRLLVATRNAGKVREIQHALEGLGLELVTLDGRADLPEPQEHGETFAENARDKALYYARATGHWALADDSGLVVDALGGAPGVYSARYAADACPPDADRHAVDQANNVKLLAELTGVPDEKRTARFVCHVALADADRVLLEADGAVEGRILHAPAGENGFGYDPLFYVVEKGCTTAQLSLADKTAISHRGQALRALAGKYRQEYR